MKITDVALYYYIILSMLIFIESPRITRQPVSVTEEKSNNASFSFSIRGYSPFRYQWYHNYTSMVNETKPNLFITNLTVYDSGSYYCYICNPDNRCISSYTVYLTVTG